VKLKTSKATEVIYQAVGAKIRMFREMQDITQGDMAKSVNLSRVSVNNVEAGRQRIQLHQIELWARILHTTPRILLKGIWW
jgi:DNA-binding XRE family transcriptional regulator